MSNVVRNVAVIGGLVMTAAGGAALYMAGLPARTPNVTAPVQTAENMATPEQIQAAGPVPYAALGDPGVWPDGVASERFTTFVRPFTFVRDSAAYAAASGNAPQLYPLRAGTAVASAEKSADGKWVIAKTEDGKAAYLLAADLGPYDPSKAPQPDAVPPISGAARVIDTGLLDVDGQRVPLTGVHGETGRYVAKMQGMIDAHGQQVTCTPGGSGYQCRLTDGLDPARAALFNGAALPSADASADYRTQSEMAKAAHRGIWN